MVWLPYDDNWEKNYLLAKSYYEEKGDLLVPSRYQTKEGDNLGQWVSRQRKRKKGSRGRKLTSEQEDLLNLIGMVWNPNELHFEKCYIEAKNYFLSVGDLEIESTYVSESGLKIGNWISNLRKAYKENKLSENKIKRLEEIGMIWSGQNSASQTSYPEQVVFYYVKRAFNDAINRYSDYTVKCW